MNALKPAELKSIEQFFQISQKNLLKIMGKYLKSKYEKVYWTKDYIVAVGDIPVALVAHLDTVFPKSPESIFYDRVKNVMWSPEGLGADDRAGVYSIIQIIKKGLRPTVIFTTDEEKGALGAEALVKEHPTVITELKYIIELDRRGSVDCVFYDCKNPKFETYVEKFGFVTAYGSFSDISIICPAWGVAGVNLSIGYVGEHSYSELLYVGNMLSTIKKVEKMLRDVDDEMEIFEYIPSSYNSFYYSWASAENDYGWDPSYGISKALWRSWHEPEDKQRCATCGVIDYDYNLFPVKGLENNTILMCADCVSDCQDVSWCAWCGEPFVVKQGEIVEDRHLCYDCEAGGVLNGND